MLHQNIAGLFNKLDSIELALSELRDGGDSVDVLCFTETFIRIGEEKNVVLKNFKMVSSYCRAKQRRGGVCILVKNNIQCTSFLLTHEIAEDKHFECCAMEIKDSNLIIICIYRTPNSNIDIFFNKINILLHKIGRKKRIIVCGDLNIDTLKDNKYSKLLNETLSNYNLKLHFNCPTRKGSCIDHIASNLPSAKAAVHSLCLSDHDTGQILKFSLKFNQVQSIWYEERRDFSSANVIKFLESIKALSFSEAHELESTNDAFNSFHDILVLFFELCFPKVMVKVVKGSAKSRWITKGLKKCCVVKRRLYITYSRARNNKQNHCKKYHAYARVLRRCINHSHKIESQNLLLKSKNKCKTVWNIIKSYEAVQFKDNSIVKIDHKGQSHTDPEHIAKLFNDYFIDITNNSNCHHTLNNLNFPSTYSSIFLKPTTPDEIRRLVTSLKNSKSVGYDGIPTWLLKRAITYVAPVICHIINLSFVEGVFPENLKLSIVKPLYKKGNANDIDNYRPVTLIPILSKVFEKAMLKRLLEFADKFNILRPEQNGFRKNKSTTLAVYKLVKSVIEGMSRGDHTAALLCDMSKAFDFVQHTNLLSKLYKYGIRGSAHEWFTSYLHNRQQCTEILNVSQGSKRIAHRSEYRHNHYGVPQGSILGPVLFLFYINDLPLCTQHESILFADDTTIVIKSKDISNLEGEINETIKKVIDWLNVNNLQVNLSKTYIMKFSTRNSKPRLLCAKYKNAIIKEVETTKFLGIQIDNMCNWKEHVNTVCLKLNRFVFALKRIREVVSREAAILAYHGYVASILNYGLIMWGNSTDSYRVFIAQKKCIRAICGAHFLEPCAPLFKSLKVLTLPCLYIKQMAVFVKQNPELFSKLKDLRHRQLRDKTDNRVYLPSIKLSLKKNANFMAAKIYNHLPEDLKKLTTAMFGYKLQVWLGERCFYSVNDFFKYDKNWTQ